MMLTAGLAGCAAPLRVIPTATALRPYGEAELGVGDQFRDFAFRGADGVVTRLSAVHGRVTILAFSDDPAWPSCDAVRELSELARRASQCMVAVRVVCVGRADAPCEEVLPRVVDCSLPAPNVILVCDPFERVYRLYGPTNGRFYVLTNFLKIVAVGDLADRETLQAAARRTVEEIYDQDIREGLYYRWNCR
ncbi:MAG: hypothetical protein KA383_12130 [Phycisphaerae bacterium]|nr:hypothetical protein [Phycisphaerae bacterium]